MNKPLIEIDNVSKLYGFGDATTVALDNISIKINKGEFVAIMGPSGSGKSTMMNILGLLDHPTHGSYILQDKPVATLSQRQAAKVRREKIGFVFQNFNLLPRLHALDNVGLPLMYKGVSYLKREHKAEKLLTSVGLKDRQYYLPPQLSGGQVQRVAIARALINDPAIVLADEPTGNLDSESSDNIMNLLVDLNKKGNTVIVVTHNPEVSAYAKRTITLKDGRIDSDSADKKQRKKTSKKKTKKSTKKTKGKKKKKKGKES